MKTWTNPEIEELEICLTATVHGDGTGKGDGGHCEAHWSNGQGNGHSGACTPECKYYDDDAPIWPEPGQPLS